MSNHTVGLAANDVIDDILKCYDKGELSFNTCKYLIDSAQHSAYAYGGNLNETCRTVRKQRCGKCLKNYEDEYCNLFRLYEYMDDEDRDKFDSYARKRNNDYRNFEHSIIDYSFTGNICQDCYEELVKDIFNNEEEAEKFILKMKNHEYAFDIFFESN